MEINELISEISSLSNEKFEELINFIDKQKSKRATDILNEAQRLARRIDKNVSISGSSRIRATINTPKYANPDDPTQTWTGMGRHPIWFKEYVAKHGSEDGLLIK